jgi:cold shock CspA family protein
MAVRQISRGVVTEFDEHEGLGTVLAEDGHELPFHCTAIADGTRTIQPRTQVAFTVRPGRAGRWEAVGLTPTGAPQI